MDIQEIINKPVQNEAECIFVIQQYIYELKGVKVKPSINLLRMYQEYETMNKLYVHAAEYYKQKYK